MDFFFSYFFKKIGIGTYANPLTFASAPGEFTSCEIIYFPYLKKYLRFEDSCAQCSKLTLLLNPHPFPFLVNKIKTVSNISYIYQTIANPPPPFHSLFFFTKVELN